MMRGLLIAVFMLGLLAQAPSVSAQAVPADEAQQSLEDRARIVGRQLRCVVCQNQSIEESDAELAADMRRRVREGLEAGQTEDEVIALMRDRYGDYVLLKPPVQGNTLILWATPFALIGLSLMWWLILSSRRSAPSAVVALTSEQEAALDRLREGSDR